MLVTVEEAKNYLRVDTADDDTLIEHIISAAEKICSDVARLEGDEVLEASEEIRIAVLFAIAYLYEHREEADHNELTISLRSLLFGVRKEGF